MVYTRNRGYLPERRSPGVNYPVKKKKTKGGRQGVESSGTAEMRNAAARLDAVTAESVETTFTAGSETFTAEGWVDGDGGNVEMPGTETAEEEVETAEADDEMADDETATAEAEAEAARAEGGDRRNADAWAEKVAMKPSMYFPPEEYSKNIKVSTRCHIKEVLETFKDLDMTETERGWFEEHPQFTHIMHMPKSNHMVQPMWMLLVRTAQIQRRKEAWFVVNGVPIRYGLREHAMISGLDCCNYPLGWMRNGSSSFKKKYFNDPKKKKILREDVRERLKTMAPDDTGDRLKMAVLYFLSSIIYCPTKSGPSGKPVLDLFLRYVDDLDMCNTFPWGRFSFDKMLESIRSTMSHFDGVVSGDWTMPGFCLPLELLAMEAIPELKRSFREEVPVPYDDCPRMCKGKWLKCELRGWPLENVYEKLGKTKVIESVLIASVDELDVLDMTMEKDDDVDEHDPVVESWEERLHNGFSVEFEEMMEEDVKGREKKGDERAVSVGRTRKTSMAELTAAVQRLTNEMSLLTEKVEKVGQTLEDRLKPLEDYVKNRQGNLFVRKGGGGKGKNVTFE